MAAQRWVKKVSGVSVLWGSLAPLSLSERLLQDLCLPLALPAFIACPLEPARDPMVGTKATLHAAPLCIMEAQRQWGRGLASGRASCPPTLPKFFPSCVD